MKHLYLNSHESMITVEQVNQLMTCGMDCEQAYAIVKQCRIQGKVLLPIDPNLVYETTFTVMPTDANYMFPLIFGERAFGAMDLCAAQTVNRFLHPSVCEGAVTYKSSVEFTKPTYVGDLIFLRGEVIGTGRKSVSISITAEREKRGQPKRTSVFKGDYVFISVKNAHDLSHHPDVLPYHPHGLSLENTDG